MGETDCNQHIDKAVSFGVTTLTEVTFSKANFALTVKKEFGIQMPYMTVKSWRNRVMGSLVFMFMFEILMLIRPCSTNSLATASVNYPLPPES